MLPLWKAQYVPIQQLHTEYYHILSHQTFNGKNLVVNKRMADFCSSSLEIALFIGIQDFLISTSAINIAAHLQSQSDAFLRSVCHLMVFA